MPMNSTRRRIAHGLLLIIVGRASADGLTVIYDSGDTQPIAPHLEILKDPTEGNDIEPPQIPSLGAADLSQLLPIHSPGLTPGPVTRTAISRPYSAPLRRHSATTQRLHDDQFAARGQRLREVA